MNKFYVLAIALIAIFIVVIVMTMIKSKKIIKDDVYDALVWAINKFPYLEAFWIAIGKGFDIPYTAEIAGLLAAAAALLEGLVATSSNNWKNATLAISEEESNMACMMEAD